MRRPRTSAAAVLLIAMIGTACGSRLPANVHSAASTAYLSSGGGSVANPGDASGQAAGSPVTTDGGQPVTTSGGDQTPTTDGNPTPVSGNPTTNPTAPTHGPKTHHTKGSSPAGSGCPTGGHDVGLTPTSMTLGTIADRTGPVAGLFAGAQQGAVAFAQYENANNGLCGHQVTIDFADSGTNCSQNQNDTANLVNKVFAFVGSFSLYDGQGCGATILKAHPTVPDIHVALDASAETLSNHFDLEPGPLGFGTGMWAYYRQKFGSKVQHAGTISVNIPSAQAKQKAQVHAAESQGWKFIYSNAHSPTTSTFTSNFQTMCGKDHIQVFFTTTENAQNAATMMANEASVSACKGVINVIPIAYDSAFLPDYQGNANDLEIYGWNGYSMFFNAEDAAKIPEVATFQQWFRRTNPGQPMNLYAMFAWADGRMLQQAFEHAKTADRAGVMTALRSLKNWSDNGLVSPMTPSSKSEGFHCYVLWHLSGGKFSRIDDPAVTASNPGGYRCDGRFLPLS